MIRFFLKRLIADGKLRVIVLHIIVMLQANIMLLCTKQ